jgi:O-antigen/teichoic acid export membrane protein
MLNRVKNQILQNKVLLENFSYLSVLQISNLLIFLFITPYLFRTLGKENYGLVVFAQTIAAYFGILVNFGFTVTATRDISINRESSEKVSIIISTVLTLKGLFFLAAMICLSVLVMFVPIMNSHPKVFFVSMLLCVSETLFPIWYFQGNEKMKYIAIINIITRITSSIFIFFIVKSAFDYVLVPLILGMGTVLGAIVGLFIVFHKHQHKFKLLTVHQLKASVKENIPLFISNVSSQVYFNANKLIVGSFLGMQELAIYDIADKIVNLLKVPVLLVGQTLFPRVSRDKDVHFIKNSMILVFIFFILVYATVYLFAHYIILFFSGSINIAAESLLRLLAFSILPICLGLFFAELVLIPFGKLKDYARMRTFSLLVYLSIIGLLIVLHQLGLYQLAITLTIVEFFVLAYSYYLCKKNKLI